MNLWALSQEIMTRDDMVNVTKIGMQVSPDFILGNHGQRRYGMCYRDR